MTTRDRLGRVAFIWDGNPKNEIGDESETPREGRNAEKHAPHPCREWSGFSECNTHPQADALTFSRELQVAQLLP